MRNSTAMMLPAFPPSNIGLLAKRCHTRCNEPEVSEGSLDEDARSGKLRDIGGQSREIARVSPESWKVHDDDLGRFAAFP